MTEQDVNGLGNERIAHLVRLCARSFSRSLQLRLAEHGITFGQWVFLRILWEEEGLTQRELSKKAGLTEPTVHTALTRLERDGYVVRRTRAENRRKQHVHLTAKGRTLRTILEPLAVQVNDSALAGVPDAEIEQLRRTLVRVLANLREDEAAAAERGLKVPATRTVNGG